MIKITNEYDERVRRFISKLIATKTDREIIDAVYASFDYPAKSNVYITDMIHHEAEKAQQ